MEYCGAGSVTDLVKCKSLPLYNKIIHLNKKQQKILENIKSRNQRRDSNNIFFGESKEEEEKRPSSFCRFRTTPSVVMLKVVTVEQVVFELKNNKTK
jgi:DNA-binding MarR family transcriptional regulator